MNLRRYLELISRNVRTTLNAANLLLRSGAMPLAPHRRCLALLGGALAASRAAAQTPPIPFPPGANVGFEVDGADLATFSQRSPSVCFAICTSTPGCVAWSWGLNTASCLASLDANVCKLKSAVGAASPQSCRAWGAPGPRSCNLTMPDVVASVTFESGSRRYYNGVALMQVCASCYNGAPVFAGSTPEGIRYMWLAALGETVWGLGPAISSSSSAFEAYVQYGAAYSAEPSGFLLTGGLFFQCRVLGRDASTPALSCAAAYAAYGAAAEYTTVWVQPLGVAAPYTAACADGGWTLALLADGSRPTFAYDAGLWTNRSLLGNAASALLRAPGTEALLQPYLDLPGVALRLVMTDAATGVSGAAVVLPASFSSLSAVISGNASGIPRISPAAWHAAVPGGGATYQTKCNANGINVVAGTDPPNAPSRLVAYRIGIVTGPSDSCVTPDTGLGIGARIVYTLASGPPRVLAPFPVAGQFVGCFANASAATGSASSPGPTPGPGAVLTCPAAIVGAYNSSAPFVVAVHVFAAPPVLALSSPSQTPSPSHTLSPSFAPTGSPSASQLSTPSSTQSPSPPPPALSSTAAGESTSGGPPSTALLSLVTLAIIPVAGVAYWLGIRRASAALRITPSELVLPPQPSAPPTGSGQYPPFTMASAAREASNIQLLGDAGGAASLEYAVDPGAGEPEKCFAEAPPPLPPALPVGGGEGVMPAPSAPLADDPSAV